MRDIRGVFLFTLIFSVLRISQASAYCTNKDISEAPKSPHKGWVMVPDSSALQILRTEGVQTGLNYNSLKILDWNVDKGENPDMYRDLNTMSANADIVLMQEAYLDTNFQNTFCERKDLDWRMASSFWDRSGTMTGVVTASRQNPSNSYFVRSPDLEPVLHTPKMMLVSEYEIPGRQEKLLLINIHGINFVRTGVFERQIIKATEVIKNHVGPIIFAGDFNLRNKDRTAFVKKVLGFYGLTHADLEYRDKNFWGFMPFDHLYQRGFDVVSAEELTSVDTSDHKPLYFELKLR